MKEYELPKDAQLNTPASEQPDASMDFTLDDIMAEFGSAAQEGQEEVRIWTPKEKSEEEPAAPAPAEEEDAEEEELPPAPVEEEPPEETEFAEDAEEEEPARPRLFVLPARKKNAEEEAEALPPPEPPTLEEAAEHYRRLCRRQRPLALGAWLCLALSLAAVLLSRSEWDFAAAFTTGLCNPVTLGALLLHCLLSLDVLVDGIRSVLSRKFTVKTFLAAAALVTLIHACATLRSSELNYSVAASALLTVGIWGENLMSSAKYRTLAACLRMEKPMAASRYPKARQEQDVLYRRRGDTEGVTTLVETEPAATKLLNAVSAILFAITLVVAAILAIRGGEDFLQVWTILLLGACPIGAALTYARTYCLASRSLKSCHAALLGWEGAARLDGECCVAVGDEDLFPVSHVRLDGVKVFGNRTAEHLMSCAAALLRRGGVRVLQRVLDESPECGDSSLLRTGDFRVYEGGGLGGEIHGDVILLGSLRFMELMNISLPEETRLKQALYISVNGVAEGVFAIRYHASDAAKSGLGLLLSQKKISTVLATRDMLLTPALVRSAYGLDADLLEYPPVQERAELAEGGEGPGQQGALLGRDSFLAFCASVCTARQMRRSVLRAAVVTVFAALLGCFLMTVFVLGGAGESVNVLRLVLYHALWLLPIGLITGRIRK